MTTTKIQEEMSNWTNKWIQKKLTGRAVAELSKILSLAFEAGKKSREEEIEKLEKDMEAIEEGKPEPAFFKILREQGKSQTLKEVKEMIEDINLDLMFTDIKDKQGNKIELSDDLMEIIRLWWEKKSEELLQKIEQIGEGGK